MDAPEVERAWSHTFCPVPFSLSFRRSWQDFISWKCRYQNVRIEMQYVGVVVNCMRERDA